MVEICAFCDNEAYMILESKQRIGNATMKEIFSVCRECHNILAKTPLSKKDIEELR